MWITEIRLKNYRAFGEEKEVKIPKGQHLLVYGENGSGKSSLFNAVGDTLTCYLTGKSGDFSRNIFLESKEDYDKELEDHRFNQIGLDKAEVIDFRPYDPGHVILFRPDQPDIQWTEDRRNSNHVSSVLQIGKSSGFLSYRTLLPIYAGPTIVLEEDEDEGRESTFFYRLIVEVLLKHYLVDDFRSGSGQVELPVLLEEIKNVLHDTEKFEQHQLILEIRERYGDEDLDENTIEELFKEFKGLQYDNYGVDKLNAIASGDLETEYEVGLRHLDQFNDLLSASVTNLLEGAEEYLKTYFDYKIRFLFGLGKITISHGEKGMKSIGGKNIELAVQYHDSNPIYDFREVLNEARLSALSLCLWLTAIKNYPAGDNDHRVLFLDDIFTGLDMNNRLPLLKLIKAEFMQADVAPFQVAIATHDRGWYELAERWFEAEKVPVKTIEMYAQQVLGENQPDRPVVLDRSSDPFKQALAHYRIGDYTACAINLRKVAESFAKARLPINEHESENTEGKRQRRKLDGLMTVLENRWQQVGVSTPLFSRFSRVRDRILNPYAHDDKGAPFYRREMKEAIDILNELNRYKVVRLVASDKGEIEPILLTHEEKTIKIFPIDNLEILTLDGEFEALFRARCQIEGVERPSDNLQQSLKFAWKLMHGGKPENVEEVYEKFLLHDGRNLAEVLTKTTPPQTPPPASESPGN